MMEEDHQSAGLFIVAMAWFLFSFEFAFPNSAWMLVELIIWYVVFGGTTYKI
jgi:hypothetical protein